MVYPTNGNKLGDSFKFRFAKTLCRVHKFDATFLQFPNDTILSKFPALKVSFRPRSYLILLIHARRDIFENVHAFIYFFVLDHNA